MAEPSAPLTQKELTDRFIRADWAAIDNALRKLCFRLLADEDDDAADDLIGDAKAKVWRGIVTGEGVRWDPLKNPDLKRYLGWVVRSGFRHGIAKPYERDRVRFEEGREPVAVEPTGDPDRLVQTRERLRAREERADRARATLDTVALAAFEGVIDGTFTPEAFAAEHGISIREANEARRRAKYRWDAAKAPGPDSSGSMRAAEPVGEDQPFEGEPES